MGTCRNPRYHLGFIPILQLLVVCALVKLVTPQSDQNINTISFIISKSKHIHTTSPSVPQPRAGYALLLLLIAGDVEVNPGPTIFPCGYCERAVDWSHRAVCCDECSFWYHKSCTDKDTHTAVPQLSVPQCSHIDP